MWVVAESAVVAALVVATEALGRRAPSYLAWWGLLPASQIVLGWFFWRLQQQSPSLPATFVYFSAFTALWRAVIAAWQGQAVGAGTWAALALLVLASWLRFLRP